MIEPTDEMLAAFSNADFTGCGNADWEDSHLRIGLAAVLPLAERQWQEQYGDAFAAGFRRAEHELCPRCGVELERDVLEDVGHRYLSTSCLHGDHGYCRSSTGAAGAKTPAQCKFCGAPCLCPCGHREAS